MANLSPPCYTGGQKIKASGVLTVFIADALLEQFIQTLAEKIWQRPELTPLREPLETALKGNEFKQLTQAALEKTPSDLPLWDKGFIEMPLVQQHLAAYIIEGQAASVEELERLYAKRGQLSADIRPVLEKYFLQMRNVFVAHPAYGGLILARGQDQLLAAIEVFRRETHDRLGILQAENASDHAEIIQQNRQVLERLEKVLEVPTIQQALEARKGVHLFLSYSRKDAKLVKEIRAALEGAGHTVWQDTTAIKGGREWIKSIAEGIKRAYAVVTVVSQAAREKKGGGTLCMWKGRAPMWRGKVDRRPKNTPARILCRPWERTIP
jgi:hypothetical protein